MNHLPLRSQRLIALCLLLLCCAAVWSLTIAPYHSKLRSLDQQIESSHQTLLGYRRVAAAGAQLGRRLDEIRAAGQAASQVLSAESADLAAADLQRQVIEMIEARSGAVQSAEILPPVAAEFFQKVSVRITLTADLAALQGVIHDLETASPPLFVDNLDVRLGNPGGSQSTRRADDGLRLRLDVYGFLEEREP